MRTICILIATASRPAALADTLRSLSGVRAPAGWRVELCVVENAVRSGVEELVRNFVSPEISGVSYLFEPRKGKSRALNRALAGARGEILVFTDDDVRFPPAWLTELTAPIIEGRADAVAGGVRLAGHLLRPWMSRTHRAWLASTADYLTPENPSEMCGANMALSRNAMAVAGNFEEELGPGITSGGEESLLSWQLKRAGLRLVGALPVEIEHHPDPSRLRRDAWIKAAEGKGRSRAYQLHHWHHGTVSQPWLRSLWLRLKLALRSLPSSGLPADRDGIPAWELSYREDIAFLDAIRREQLRPRNYPANGIRKISVEPSNFVA